MPSICESFHGCSKLTASNKNKPQTLAQFLPLQQSAGDDWSKSSCSCTSCKGAARAGDCPGTDTANGQGSGIPTQPSPICCTAQHSQVLISVLLGHLALKQQQSSRIQDLPAPHLASYQLVCRARGKCTKLLLIFFPSPTPTSFLTARYKWKSRSRRIQ